MTAHSVRQAQFIRKIGIALFIGIAIGVVAPRLVGGSSVSAFEVARQLQAAGVTCTPGDLVNTSGGAVREGLPCTDGDLMYEITTYPTKQATDEVTRMVEDGVGCKLAVSRSSKVFTLLIGDKFSIFVASTLPTGIETLTKTRLVFQDDCRSDAI